MFIRIFLLLSFLLFTKLYSEENKNDFLIIKCKETTGTGRSDIFRFKKPIFEWYYKGKWYELTDSKNSPGKDWKVIFTGNKIKFFNNKTKWDRSINLENMTALMNFPTGEQYLYSCNYINE